ncbi:hypothetical protein DSL72_004289 [Monilinia vaccinii-corymbosi]|uniref:Uncharacterized protein n=1 Tax=Monilinia vaccinii-corymbosi TaxID=61207 RepID=A0A8A3NYW9_9HELO|nr:hypothetical protein DSL72_004289 [Monilinia vaccinii-corymbosi]
MDVERKMKAVNREIEAMRGDLGDDLARSVVELCHRTIESIEFNRAAKLGVWKDFHQPLCINGIVADKHSAEHKQMIVDKYYQLYKTLPALEELRDLDLARKFVVEQLNTQVLAAEQCEKYAGLQEAKEMHFNGGKLEGEAKGA